MRREICSLVTPRGLLGSQERIEDSTASREGVIMKFESLQDLLIDQLQDLYSAENLILKALPKMIKAASFPELRSGFEQHLEQTKEHVNRLERVFKKLNTSAKSKTCQAMEGIIEEGDDLMDELENADLSVKDAGLICAAQRVEHYEMAVYGCVRTWCRQLGHDDCAD